MEAHLETSCLPASVRSTTQNAGKGFLDILQQRFALVHSRRPQMLLYSRSWNDCPQRSAAEEYFSKQTSDNGTYQYLFILCARGGRLDEKFNAREDRSVQWIIYRLEKKWPNDSNVCCRASRKPKRWKKPLKLCGLHNSFCWYRFKTTSPSQKPFAMTQVQSIDESSLITEPSVAKCLPAISSSSEK